MTRYALADLLAVVGGPPHREVAHVARVEVSTVHQWVQRGLSPWQADRLAVAYGRHPVAVWPTWFEDALKVKCACQGCTVWFLPEQGRRAHRRFCSPRCKHRHNRRRWLARPENRERHRAERKRYYHEVEKRAA